MNMTVYADVLFLVNFSLDYVTLYITGRLMSHSSSLPRMAAASAAGAVYAVSALVFDLDGVFYVVLSLLVTLLMCVCAYKRAGLLGYITSAILLFSVGTAIGGAVTAICSLGAGYRGALESDPYGDAAVFAVAALAALVTAVSARTAKRRLRRDKRRVTVNVEGRSVTLEALADSGSLIRDPLSGVPVLIVRADAVRGVLPPDVYGAAVSGSVADVTSLDAKSLTRVRMLPVSGVIGDGLLIGYRPDSVTVPCGRTEREVSCFLALSPEKNGFGGCDAILPSEFI